MTPHYHQTSISTFQKLVPGSNIRAERLRKLGKFEEYNPSGAEHDMYPPLVWIAFVLARPELNLTVF